MTPSRMKIIALLFALPLTLMFGCKSSIDLSHSNTMTSTYGRPTNTPTLTPTTPPVITEGDWLGDTDRTKNGYYGKIFFRILDGGLTVFHILFDNNFDHPVSHPCGLVGFEKRSAEKELPLAIITNGIMDSSWEERIYTNYDFTISIRFFFIDEKKVSGGITITTTGCSEVFSLSAERVQGTHSEEALIQTADYIPPVPGPEISQMHLEEYSTCAVTTSGELWCWGRGGSAIVEVYSTVATKIKAFTQGVENYIGYSQGGCALLKDNSIECWGRNDLYQFGNGVQEQGNTLITTPEKTSGIEYSAVYLAGYGINYCALLNSGSVKCWGWSGYLYDTNISRGIVPVEIKGIGSGVRSIIANEYRACALYDNGTVKCWGVYSKSQFIGSTYYPNYTPTLLPGFTDIISFGDTTSNDICGISSKGKVICYENPKVTDLFTNPVVHLAAMYSMLCGVSESGAIECWKINNWYDESAINYEPVDMPGLESGVRNVYSGPTHMCAVLSNNVVKCWGENKFGQLGDGTGRNSDIPVAVRWK